MNRIRAWIRSFFGFSRTEINGFLILIPLIAVVIFSEPLFERWDSRNTSIITSDTQKLDSLMAAWQWAKDSVNKSIAPQRFDFNPNTASKEDLLALGFRENMADRIINYRSKKGVFKIKSDLLKMYGMDTAFYSALKNHILLPETYQSRSQETSPVVTEKSKTPANLNEADSAALVKIYGIGPKLAIRIINYRKKLGGFVATHQLKEVYGLDSTVIREVEKKFSLAPTKPIQLNINTASEKELAAHPYIGWKLAKAIVAYRFQHGSFQKLEDLTQIQLISESALSKMKPYLTY